MEKEEEKELYELGRCWNGFVRKLQGAENLWEEFQKKLLYFPRDGLESAPLGLQKAAGKFRRAKFNVMLPRFVDYYRAYGGLEDLIVPLSPLKEKEEKKEVKGDE